MTEINFYGEQDMAVSRKTLGKSVKRMLGMGVPFAVLAIVGFCMRLELLCIVAAILSGAVMIFYYDLRVSPLAWYNRFLGEIRRGMTHQTAGTLKSIGQETVFQEHVNFYEVIVNIYEDQDPEGDRRFLLDCSRKLPEEWIGRDVAVTSQGNFITGMRLMGVKP